MHDVNVHVFEYHCTLQFRGHVTVTVLTVICFRVHARCEHVAMCAFISFLQLRHGCQIAPCTCRRVALHQSCKLMKYYMFIPCYVRLCFLFIHVIIDNALALVVA